MGSFLYESVHKRWARFGHEKHELGMGSLEFYSGHRSMVFRAWRMFFVRFFPGGCGPPQATLTGTRLGSAYGHDYPWAVCATNKDKLRWNLFKTRF